MHLWGDPTYRIKDLRGDGKLEFVTKDDRFAGRFDCFACSPLPLQIWTFSGGRFRDITRMFPSLIKADLRTYDKCLPIRAANGKDETGCLPAWAADEAMLGHGAAIRPMLERALGNNNLGAPGSPVPSAAAYITSLMHFLQANDYMP